MQAFAFNPIVNSLLYMKPIDMKRFKAVVTQVPVISEDLKEHLTDKEIKALDYMRSELAEILANTQEGEDVEACREKNSAVIKKMASYIRHLMIEESELQKNARF